MNLLLTLLTGLFFLLGIFLNYFCHDKNKVGSFSIGLAFVILLNLLFGDIIPEVVENFSLWGIFFILLGLIFLKILDILVPHHSHHHHDGDEMHKDHQLHERHISIITILALSIHNILECMALYQLSLNDFKSGIYMSLGIALHNIPLGFQIGSQISKKSWAYMLVLTFSGFLGGIISLLMGEINPIFESYILCLTLGMLIYLTFFELFPELLSHKKNKYALYGIIIGIILIIIGLLI